MNLSAGNRWSYLLLFLLVFLFGLLVAPAIGIGLRLSDPNKAVVLATAAGAIGTFLLAVATFFNILQSRRQLEIEEKEQTRPMVKDELSYVIQPAISGLEENIEYVEEHDGSGCAFNWVYVDEPVAYSLAGQPRSVYPRNIQSVVRPSSDNSRLRKILIDHAKQIQVIAAMASDFLQELGPEIQRRFEQDNIPQGDRNEKAVANAVLSELDHFADTNRLHDFWERYGSELIDLANSELEVAPERLEAAEEEYYRSMGSALEELRELKRERKQEFGISEDEIESKAETPFEFFR